MPWATKVNKAVVVLARWSAPVIVAAAVYMLLRATLAFAGPEVATAVGLILAIAAAMQLAVKRRAK